MTSYKDVVKDRWAAMYKDGYNSFSGQMMYNMIFNKLTRYLRGDKEVVLDIGCGNGDCFEWLRPYVAKYNGVDIAKAAVERASKRWRPTYPLKIGKLLEVSGEGEIPFEDNSFTLVFSGLVVQHIRPEYLKKYVREAARVLQSNGILAMHYTNFHVYNGLRHQQLEEKLIANDSIENNTMSGMFSHKKEDIIEYANEAGFKFFAHYSLLANQHVHLQNAKADWHMMVMSISSERMRLEDKDG